MGSAQVVAAVDVDGLARHEVSVRRGEEQDRTDEVLGLLVALEGPLSLLLLDLLGREAVCGGVTTSTVMPSPPISLASEREKPTTPALAMTSCVRSEMVTDSAFHKRTTSSALSATRRARRLRTRSSPCFSSSRGTNGRNRPSVA
jgi:hypothetical protein